MKHEVNCPTHEAAIAKDNLKTLGWDSHFDRQLPPQNTTHSFGRIIGTRKNSWLAHSQGAELLTTLSGRFRHNPDNPYPAVGDWVLLNESTIIKVLQRKNFLSRAASGMRGKESLAGSDQTIAANLDMVFIVCGLDRDFNPRRVERYLTLVYNSGINPAILLTKADLHEEPADYLQAVEDIAFGVPTYLIAENNLESLDQLAPHLAPGNTVALIGSSGAGKSTLINRLAGEDLRSTGSVGERVGKGKHTTTSRDLILLPSGAMIIDNPGIREVGFSSGQTAEETVFPEIEALAHQCRFCDCGHLHEPHCAVQKAIADGTLSPERLQSYLKIQNELSYLSQRESLGASRTERERWKGVSQKIKTLKKRR